MLQCCLLLIQFGQIAPLYEIKLPRFVLIDMLSIPGCGSRSDAGFLNPDRVRIRIRAVVDFPERKDSKRKE